MSNAPTTVASIAEAVWSYEVERSPYLRLRNGLPVEGLRVGTLQEAEEDAAFARAQLAALTRVDSTAGETEDWLTAQFLAVVLTEVAEGPETWWWSFPVTPYGNFRLTADTMQAVASLDQSDHDDAERLRRVAADYATAIRTADDKLRQQTERGWRLPRAAMVGALGTLRGMRTTAERLFAPVDTVLTAEILPAFDAILDYVDRYPSPAEGVGLGQYPGGEDAYARLVRSHATYDTTIDEVHALGVAEVARLTEELQAVRGQIGFRGTEQEFRRTLEAEGRIYATDPNDVEARYLTAIRRIEPVLSDAFAVLPAAPYAVARLDPTMEAGVTYGYYEPPTTAVPVGRYRYNGSGLDTRSQLNAAAIIYHELIPGHHFHLARQKENDSLPAIRRESAAFSAFTEGWAEYATGVADELGMYEDPYDRYGWLIHQRFVAQRLVIDTGMNALGWSLDRGRAYMAEMTFESAEQVATETLRYSTDLPGQALGYRLGCLKFRELRARFGGNAKEFHELVLQSGALPLSVVERHLQRQARGA